MNPARMKTYWEHFNLTPPGDAAQMLVKLAREAGLTLEDGQAFVVASLIELAMLATDLERERNEGRRCR